MNRDTVIRLAREAGIGPICGANDESLERFAALVAAHEREECAGIAERRVLVEATKDQRIGHYEACKNIAAAIRSRT